MRTRLLLSILALLPLGCAPATEPLPEPDGTLHLESGAEVLFRAERAEYRRGETARIVLRNRTDQALGYNLCLSARELRVSGAWKRFEPLRVCAAVLYTLAPGGETTLEEPITAEWEPGEYRMVTSVELMRRGTRAEVASTSFTVRP